MADVALVTCRDYHPECVQTAVEKGLDLLGGAGMFFKAGETLLLKPNLLVPELPRKCVTTHPEVFRAVAKAFLDSGAKLTYGDSPAVGGMKRAARKAGISEVARNLGIEEADFKNGTVISGEDVLQNMRFTVAKGALECDGIISLPKLKTHALERYTGSVKNQFGCVPGILKGEFHIKLPDAHDFGKMLVDLNNLLRPRLYVMDGIQAMEGNGPRGGTVKQMKVLLMSADPIALDATVCRLIGLDPEIVPTIVYGARSGAGTYREDEISILGDSIEALQDKSFDIRRTPIRPNKSGNKGIAKFINDRMIPKPRILPDKCTQCGTCVSMCPVRPKAVDWFDGDKEQPPSYDYNRCVRCYCCQEVCPDSAIELRQPVLRRLLNICDLK